jgi:hypothetical protein
VAALGTGAAAGLASVCGCAPAAAQTMPAANASSIFNRM